MSKTIKHTEVWSGYPSTYSGSASNASNAYDSGSDNTYATISERNSATFQFPSVSLNGYGQAITALSMTAYLGTSGQGSAQGTAIAYRGSTSVGTSVSVPRSKTQVSIPCGEGWTPTNIAAIGLNVSSSGKLCYLYGATLTVDYEWDEMIYEVSTMSLSTSATVYADSSETTSGGTNAIRFFGIDDISRFNITDNGSDISSMLVNVGGGSYTYTLSNMSSDHSIVVDDVELTAKDIYIRRNGSFTKASRVMVRENGTWVERSVKRILKKGSSVWGLPMSPTSGTTDILVVEL